MTRRWRTPRISLERLLDGETDGTALSDVLAAARNPGRPDEVAGLGDALTAFAVSGPLAPVSTAPLAAAAPASTRTVAGRSVAARVAVLTGGSMLVGGAAFAAVVTTGGGTHRPAQVPQVTSSTVVDDSGGYVTTPVSNGATSRAHPAAKPSPSAHPHPHPTQANGAAHTTKTSGVSGDRGHPKHPNPSKPSEATHKHPHPDTPLRSR